MKIIQLFLFAIISSSIYAQAGAGPETDCTPIIPQICPYGSYPASTTGTATAAGTPGNTFNCPGTSPIVGQPAFFI